jgi:hypothetical protein
MKEDFNCYLEEKNVIQCNSDSYFYMTTNTNPIRYGVALNENDIEKAEQIIQKAKREHKEEIQAWNEEQLRRNLHIQNNYS